MCRIGICRRSCAILRCNCCSLCGGIIGVSILGLAENIPRSSWHLMKVEYLLCMHLSLISEGHDIHRAAAVGAFFGMNLQRLVLGFYLFYLFSVCIELPWTTVIMSYYHFAVGLKIILPSFIGYPDVLQPLL